MHKVFATSVLIVLIPFLASAQAGFPEKPLWLSNAKPAAGEEISLSTVLYNGTSASVGGTVAFFVDTVQFKTQNVSLAAQSSTVVSAQWTATAGSHSFSARFGSGSGSSSEQQTAAIQVIVAEPPPPSALQQNVSQATEVASTLASSSAPIVQKVAQAVFTQTEALRNASISYLQKKVDAPTAKKTAGEKTSNVTGFASSSSAQSSGSTLHNIGQAALAATLFTLRSLYLFYPLLALIFFLILYWAVKKLRRPNR